MKGVGRLKVENVTDAKHDVNRRLLDDPEQKSINFEQQLSKNIENKAKEKTSILRKISENMDLALLKDSRYVAVILGNT